MNNKNELSEVARHLLNQIARGNRFIDFMLTVGKTSTINEIASEKKLHVVCKVTTFNKNHRQEYFTDLSFKNEVLFYNKLWPAFDEFQHEKYLPIGDQFRRIPKCLLAQFSDDSLHQVIVLADLRPKGFNR